LITPETPKTATFILKILEPLLGHGHTLWMDNFYDSQELATQLKVEHSTNYAGSLTFEERHNGSEK
jgi:hypothetical protein